MSSLESWCPWCLGEMLRVAHCSPAFRAAFDFNFPQAVTTIPTLIRIVRLELAEMQVPGHSHTCANAKANHHRGQDYKEQGTFQAVIINQTHLHTENDQQSSRQERDNVG